MGKGHDICEVDTTQYLIGIDGDDTLWYTEIVYEGIYNSIKKECTNSFIWEDNAFNSLLMSNIGYMGYGMKTYCLTLIEYIQSKTKNSAKLTELTLYLCKQTWYKDIRLYKDAMNVVKELNSTFNLILITQGDSYEQMSKIKRSGIDFNDIEILPQKTEQSYMDILNKRGIEPVHFVMIGNSFKSDVLPTINIGSKAIYVKSEWQFEVVEDSLEHLNLYRIGDLVDSVSIINKIIHEQY